MTKSRAISLDFSTLVKDLENQAFTKLNVSFYYTMYNKHRWYASNDDRNTVKATDVSSKTLLC